MTTRTVRDVLVSVRSKNAGPFTVTFDLFFPDAETFHDMQQRGVITPEVVGGLDGLAPGLLDRALDIVRGADASARRHTGEWRP